ncbi:CBS domain-containing protein [Methanosphaerula palustris]|uniref:CBS domain containing protein n=1 Tax=Methanosphaerula palustris (strain ATCC BAA-1556 / DSM 19958 / E1-9c) TaxID=521011 RepID=B8GKC3_METPE|nr:CBS domain-containing protein [Methanosphaerula palustris]ACL15806.1 CBS domain containing protein [Methanosphaerula palustris E1-9c]
MNEAEAVQSDLALTPVSEIMRETVLKVIPETPVIEIFSWFRKRGHTHLIITDAEGSVLGVITSFDLLSAISPTIGIQSGRKYLSLDRLIKSNARVAGDLMAPIPVIMNGTEPLVRALEMMEHYRYPYTVVTDKKGHLTGIVEFADIVKFLINKGHILGEKSSP